MLNIDAACTMALNRNIKMNTKYNILKTSLLIMATIMVGSLKAAMINIPNYTVNSSGSTLGNFTFADPINSGTFYYSGAIKWNTFDPDGVEWINIDDTNVSVRRHRLATPNTLYIRRDYQGNTIDTAVPNLTISQETSLNFTLKIDYQNNLISFWLNPDFNLSENVQANPVLFNDPIDSLSALRNIYYTASDPGAYTADITYSSQTVHTLGDTPFAIPEPETYALLFGGLALGFVMLQRRKKA